MCKILCGKCKEIRPGTKHHIFPRRFYGGIGAILWLCRKCHDALEKLIPQHTPLQKDEYIQLAREFLEDRQ